MWCTVNWRLWYTAALWMLLPLVVARLWWRGLRERTYAQGLGQRFGLYSQSDLRPHAGGTIWLHAVSLGEVNAAKPMVHKLIERFPDCRIVLTQMTATGRDAAMVLAGDRVRVVWLPYDYPFAVRRFLAAFRPDIGIIIETEIWFNLIAASKRAGIPLLLANGRLSEKSLRGYMRIAPLARSAFAAFDVIAAQTEADAARFRSLGACTVNAVGNLKFDSAAAPQSSQSILQLRSRFAGRPVFLVASTREGEEELVLDALAHASVNRAIVVIVPRHPNRFDAVATMLKRRGLKFQRRSAEAHIANDCSFMLGDSMGEMAAYYASCDVALIGGSLLDFGGQNLIEACAEGVPVIVGPHTRNFEQAAQLAIEAGAARRAESAGDAVAQAIFLLENPQVRAKMGKAGREFCARHRGATVKMVEFAARLLEMHRSTTARPG